MNDFKKIDSKLESLCQNIGAKLTKDRPHLPESFRTFEERRIDWIDHDIRKAIIIAPTFEHNGVNSSLWNFTIVAWQDFTRKKTYVMPLSAKKPFSEIENNIDLLLKQALDVLSKIKETDLKKFKNKQ
jgi:hypothetical protein